MKMRTRNPAASTDIGSVIQSETARQRYIAVQVATNPPNDVASCPRLRANIGAWNPWVPESIWSICGITAPTPGGDEPASGPAHAPPQVGRSRRRDNAGRRAKRRIRARQNHRQLSGRWRRASCDRRLYPSDLRTDDLLAFARNQHVTGSLLHAFSERHQTECSMAVSLFAAAT